jgi:hypothetical protein
LLPRHERFYEEAGVVLVPVDSCSSLGRSDCCCTLHLRDSSSNSRERERERERFFLSHSLFGF